LASYSTSVSVFRGLSDGHVDTVHTAVHRRIPSTVSAHTTRMKTLLLLLTIPLLAVAQPAAPKGAKINQSTFERVVFGGFSIVNSNFIESDKVTFVSNNTNVATKMNYPSAVAGDGINISMNEMGQMVISIAKPDVFPEQPSKAVGSKTQSDTLFYISVVVVLALLVYIIRDSGRQNR
jgi:hypothetical protein